MACGHCGFAGDLEKKGQVLVHRETYTDDRTGMSLDYDTYVQIFVCPSCDDLTVDRYDWSDVMDPEDAESEVLYPRALDISGLPATVAKEYARAHRTKDEPVFYALGVRRTLEALCTAEGAQGKTLFDRLKNLADTGRLPDVFVEMATILRRYGNLGAHHSDDEPTPEDVAIVGEFAEAIIEYLYRAPAKVTAVRAALDARQKRGTSS
jgi:hypothetical protein